MKKPVGALWGEEGYVAIFNPQVVASILKAVGMPDDYKAEALVVKKKGAKYVEVWEIPFLPHTIEYAYRIYPREGEG